MFQIKIDGKFLDRGILNCTIFGAILFSSTSLISQEIPKIITDKKIASQNYLPDYSYAGCHYGEMKIPEKTLQIINATDYGVIVNVEFSNNNFTNNPIKVIAVLWGEKDQKPENNTVKNSGEIKVEQNLVQKMMY